MSATNIAAYGYSIPGWVEVRCTPGASAGESNLDAIDTVGNFIGTLGVILNNGQFRRGTITPALSAAGFAADPNGLWQMQN